MSLSAILTQLELSILGLSAQIAGRPKHWPPDRYTLEQLRLDGLKAARSYIARCVPSEPQILAYLDKREAG